MTQKMRMTQSAGLRAKTSVLAAGLMALAGTASAQSQVVLEAKDGSVRLQGELVAFEEGLYTLSTEIGLLTVDEVSVTCIGDGCPTADPDIAEVENRNVVLIADGGSTEIVGELVSFEDNAYTVQTVLGTFQVDARGVECQGAVCPVIEPVADPRFTIYGGEDTVRDLLPALLAGYARDRGLIYNLGDKADVVRLLSSEDGSIVADIAISPASSFEAFAALASNEADLALVDQSLGVSLGGSQTTKEYLIAHDALVLVTHEDNPVRDLTTQELARLWSGDVDNWLPFGGGDIPVTVHMPEARVGQDAQVFNTEVLRANGLTITDIEDVAFHASGEDVVAAVAADRNAIGLTNRVAARKAGAKVLDLRMSCGLMTSPSDFELKVENYPLSRPVLGYIPSQNPHPTVQDFMEWTQLNDAQLRVSDAGFSGDRLHRMKIRDMGIGLVQTAAAAEFDGRQFASMLRELRDADRLSITFRFERGSSVLDTDSVAVLEELATRLRANEFEGLEVLLVGFADSSGGAALNTELAQARAEAVSGILRGQFDAQTLSQLKLTPLSFGEQMPLACNETDAGRASNRRVEVWVREPGQL